MGNFTLSPNSLIFNVLQNLGVAFVSPLKTESSNSQGSEENVLGLKILHEAQEDQPCLPEGLSKYIISENENNFTGLKKITESIINLIENQCKELAKKFPLLAFRAHRQLWICQKKLSQNPPITKKTKEYFKKLQKIYKEILIEADKVIENGRIRTNHQSLNFLKTLTKDMLDEKDEEFLKEILGATVASLITSGNPLDTFDLKPILEQYQVLGLEEMTVNSNNVKRKTLKIHELLNILNSYEPKELDIEKYKAFEYKLFIFFGF